MFGDAEMVLPKLQGQVDGWFLDGFAPSKNAKMWSEKLINEIALRSHENTKLATFTAAGKVRRDLEQSGFIVEKQPGFGKKRERITASFQGAKTQQPKPSSVAIIGAGIAGVMLANKLQKRGLEVILIDKHSTPAQETSSNPAALISPKLALGTDPYDRLLSLSFLQAVNYYDKCKNVWLGSRGLLSIAKDTKNQNHLNEVATHFIETHNWGNILHKNNKQEITKKWQVESQFNGIYFPTAGSINTKSLIEQLCEGVNYQQAEIVEVTKANNHWLTKTATGQNISKTDVVVLACGLNSYGALNHEASPLIANRGQISLIEDKLPDGFPSLSFGHYLTAPFINERGEKLRIIGASHSRLKPEELSSDKWREFSQAEETEQIDGLTNLTNIGQIPVSFKAGIRATTIDHMPIVGELACPQALQRLPKNRQKIFPNQLEQSHKEQGKFIFTGLGARGFQLAPILSEVLSAQIMKEALPIDSEIVDAIDPARFALRRRRHEKL